MNNRPSKTAAQDCDGSPRIRCTCEPYSQDAGGGYFELLAEPDPDCRVHFPRERWKYLGRSVGPPALPGGYDMWKLVANPAPGHSIGMRWAVRRSK